jgi:CheY-like chemotaxis protein
VNRGATDRTTRVIIAEDHTLMAQGLRKLLECEFESVTIVGNGRELIDRVTVSNPDVALVDIVMPLLNAAAPKDFTGHKGDYRYRARRSAIRR